MFQDKTIDVITRRLDPQQIKSRPGKAGRTFNYIATEDVVRLLNEAFDYRWSTEVMKSERVDNEVVVLLELRVWDTENSQVIKQQWGSAEILNQEVGHAYKAATSDALKKAATLLGVALELYDDVVQPERASFSRPAAPPPRPPAPAPTRPVAAPPADKNPFEEKAPRPVPRPATLPRPSALPPVPGARPAPVAAPRPPATPTPPQLNPWRGNRGVAVGSTGPNPTQLTALTNIATRKNLSQRDLIALALIADDLGNPVETFEELTYDQAVRVIKAAQ